MDWGSAVPHKQWSALPEGFWGESEFYRTLEEAMCKQGRIGQEIDQNATFNFCPRGQNEAQN